MPTVDPAAVARWLGLPGDSSTDANLAAACSHAGVFVDGLPWVASYAAEHGSWPPVVEQPAVMLAARLYRRRNTPSGVETFADSPATYVARHDPDVARALRIGPHAMPAVG